MNHPQFGRLSVRIALAALAGITFNIAAGPASSATAAEATSKVTLKFDSTTRKLSGFPATLKGGLVTIALTGGGYGVNLQLARMTSAHTDAEIQKAVDSEDGPPSWTVLQGGTAGGATLKVTRTATVNLDKGDYFWIMFSDGEELDTNAPWARFSVTGAKSAKQPSGGTAIVKTLEYGFDTSGLKAGRNTVTFINGGKEWHHVIMAKLLPGKTLADFQKAVATDGPPPVGLLDDAAGASLPVLSGGLTEVADLDLKPGTYVFACFMPDRAGKPHVVSGMIKEVKIV